MAETKNPTLDEVIVVDVQQISNEVLKIGILEPCSLFSSHFKKLPEPSNDNNDINSSEILRTQLEDQRHRFIMEEMYKNLINNLNITGLYDISVKNDFCHHLKKGQDISPYIFSKELMGFDFIISTDVYKITKDILKLKILVWDIMDERFVNGKYYLLTMSEHNNNSYRLANVIADYIFQATSSESSGIFDSRLIYITESGTPPTLQKQVTLMNFDGSHRKAITNGLNLKLTPVFSRQNTREIFYLEYLLEGPFVVKYNLETGKATKIAGTHTMTSSLNANRLGNQAVLAGTEDDASTNLFLLDLLTNTQRKLTKGSGISTSASFNPEGDKIVFVSDRTGQKKLYVKNLIHNGEETLISKNAGNYDCPSWSPDGKLIAFVKIIGKKFHLGLLTPEGESERYLTADFLLEGPRWAPNSRYILYTRQSNTTGKTQLYIMDILTRHEYHLNTPIDEGASDPDWILNNN
jgi:TolB protein